MIKIKQKLITEPDSASASTGRNLKKYGFVHSDGLWNRDRFIHELENVIDFGVISRGEQLHETLIQYSNPQRIHYGIPGILQKY